jgi:hypothetical protein
MAYPVVASTSTYTSGATNTTTHIIGMPSGIQQGDLLINVFSIDLAATITIPSDWTLIARNNATGVSSSLAWKFAAGGDSMTITTSISDIATAITYRITGADIILSATNSSSSAVANPVNPTLTTALEGLEKMWLVFCSGDNSSTASAPSGYGNLINLTAGSTSGASTHSAHRLDTNAEESPPAWTRTAEEYVTRTVMVASGPKLGGTVLGPDGLPAQRTLFAINRTTGNRISFSGHTPTIVSDPVTGAWSVGATNYDEHVVVCLDDADGVEFNDLVLRLNPL